MMLRCNLFRPDLWTRNRRPGHLPYWAGLFVTLSLLSTCVEPSRELLPDMAIVGCYRAADCDDHSPCTADVCELNRTCSHTPIDCSAFSGSCSLGVCNPETGACEATSAHDGELCPHPSGDTGSCLHGDCLLDLSGCNVINRSLGCGGSVTGSTIDGNMMVKDYPCAQGEAGPEVAYPFKISVERPVTITLTDTNEIGVDLDLLVLEGKHCVATAACVGSSVVRGTGNESVTFTARAGIDYLIVVEGVNAAAQGKFKLKVDCGKLCGPAVPLSCNMTMSGNTAREGAPTSATVTRCGEARGPEEVYSLAEQAGTVYQMSLTQLDKDLDLHVLASLAGDCDGFCKASGLNLKAQSEQVTFTGENGGNSFVLVESKGAGGPYQLEVACVPSCRPDEPANQLFVDCSKPSDVRSNDGQNSTRKIDAWSCDADTTGGEVVYQFFPAVKGNYTVDLQGLSADLDLIVLEGVQNNCLATSACLTSSTQVGTAAESVTFAADTGKNYWIIVDGKKGATSTYSLRLRSSACPAAPCVINSANRLSCQYRQDERSNDDSKRSGNAVDEWKCAGNTSGPEVVYSFKPQTAGTYTVDVDQLTSNLDLIVTAADPTVQTCSGAVACVASSTNAEAAPESVTFQAQTGLVYYIAVDGKAGSVGPYRIRLSSSQCGAPACQDGADTLSCTRQSTSKSNDAAGATRNVDSWACDQNTTGPEFVHQFVPSGPGPYAVKLDGLKADLDLLVVLAGDASTAKCEVGAACLASSVTSGTAAEQVTFMADPHKIYYLIVDGKDGAVSPYTLFVTGGCP